ncbi:MAG: hypothetical protein QXF80_06880 [Thermoplasmatales archaeon]
MVKFSELRKDGKSSAYPNKDKSVADVLDLPLEITGIDYIHLPDTDDVIMIIHTKNQGDIRTGSKTLIKQGAWISDVTAKGEIVQAKITRKKSSKSRFNYFTFDDV